MRMLTLFLSAILAFTLQAAAQKPVPVNPLTALALAPVFGNSMVLQRDLKLPVWGTATNGITVTVEFAGQKKTTTADEQGKWRVTLDPLEASATPRTLTVTAGTEKKDIKDVLVGEVWLGAGQSNMAGQSKGYFGKDPVLTAYVEGEFPQIRFQKPGAKPGEFVWLTATDRKAADFSAHLFCFGVRLHQELKVPVGLMTRAAGGNPSCHFLSEEAFNSDPGIKAEIEKAKASFDLKAWEAELAKRTDQHNKALEKAKAKGEPTNRIRLVRPAKPGESVDDYWIKPGKNYNGIRALQPFAIRGVLWDQGEAGTGMMGVSQPALMRALVECWRKDWGQDIPFLIVQKPSGGGRAWDYNDPIAIGVPQPAPYPDKMPERYFGEDYIKLKDLPGCYLVTTSDLNPGYHFPYKSAYGARGVQVALRTVYDRLGEYLGPTFKSFAVEGKKIRVKFDHVGQGLTVPPDVNPPVVTGFAVAGKDNVFKWAKAMIDPSTDSSPSATSGQMADSVVVECEEVPEPVNVRYAWSDGSAWANLFSKAGLPALSFRTDKLPGAGTW